MALRRQISTIDDPREFLHRLSDLVAETVHAKAGIVGKRSDRWVIAAESAASPKIPLESHEDEGIFDRARDKRSDAVVVWRAQDSEWTLIRLADRPDATVFLVLEGDWGASAAALRTFAHSLVERDPRIEKTPREVDHIARRLTRTLADSTGMAAVAEVVLRHALEIAPSAIASLAVATNDAELSIVATHGYPCALVEHLRIASGTGIIGSVHQSQNPMLVPNARVVRGPDRQRSRYRTDAFAAIPIVAGAQSLGVLSLTDRISNGPYTAEETEAIAMLMAPAALALGRERVSREAESHAQAAVIDPVSGLFNRRYFQVRLDEELQRSTRQQSSVALLLIDLDGFKGINDAFGHVAGDLVIRDISEILRRSVRIFDVCTRFGGEEFAVMMPGGSAEGAGVIAERIRRRIEAYQRREAELSALRVTASIGVAVSSPTTAASELIERADRALYRAKSTGKNRVHIADGDGGAA